MILLFKKTTIATYVAIILAFLVAGYLYFPTKAVNEFGVEVYYYGLCAQNGEVQSAVFPSAYIYMILVGAFIEFILVFFISYYSSLKHKNLLGVLYDNCDYKRFINLYQPAFERQKRLRVLKSPLTCTAELHYARALFLSGNTKDSIEILEAISNKKRNRRKQWIALKMSAICSLALNCYFVEDEANALSCYEKANLVFEGNFKIIKSIMAQYYYYISVSTHVALGLVLNKEYKKAEEFITLSLGKKILALDKFYLHCLLSRVSVEMGNCDKAMEHLNVAEEMVPESYPVLQIRNELNNIGTN